MSLYGCNLFQHKISSSHIIIVNRCKLWSRRLLPLMSFVAVSWHHITVHSFRKLVKCLTLKIPCHMDVDYAQECFKVLSSAFAESPMCKTEFAQPPKWCDSLLNACWNISWPVSVPHLCYRGIAGAKFNSTVPTTKCFKVLFNLPVQCSYWGQ